ncbi:unnamed protein product [Phytomonas sp. Hart1]|nr:unnamed protein product [Phytomonas sp. Hart1]|eukprot:CCW68009.1 unnamed protein product [Phytomonas sp. isolate Hart1]
MPEQLNLPSAIPLGTGTISNVLHATLAPPWCFSVAVKIYSKIQLLQLRKVESVLNEKKALQRLSAHPYICRLYGTAQSEDELYAVMELLPNGDLLQHIRRTATKRVRDYTNAQRNLEAPDGGAERRDSTDSTPSAASDRGGWGVIPASSRTLRCLDFPDLQLITAQLILGLSHVFGNGLVLRDLKPENVVFDSKWRACLIDFDTVDLKGNYAKPHTNHGVALPERRTSVNSSTDKPNDLAGVGAKLPRRSIRVSEIQEMRKCTASFCGTAQYVSPEMVSECKWSFSSDLWALGTIVYEMLYGVHMFAGKTSFEVMKKVIKGIAGGVNDQASVPFPIIDFAESGEEASQGLDDAPSSAFARVKDFILRLVDIDPYQRLGVNPETHEFDLDALKSHALFCDFDWSVVNHQIQTFKPNLFTMNHVEVNSDQASAPKISNSDLSPSLESFYHEVPYNDQQYVDYVYNVSSEANPFEHYLQCIDLTSKADENVKGDADGMISHPNVEFEGPHTSSSSRSSPNTDVGQVVNPFTPDHIQNGEIVDSLSAVKQTSSSQRSSEDFHRSSSIDTDDESIEIIDDVGVRFHAMTFDPDFRL